MLFVSFCFFLRQIDNISTCLGLLTALNIPLEGVTPNDIHDGSLKAILTVFFALSRYKQQQKQQQHQQQEMAKYVILIKLIDTKFQSFWKMFWSFYFFLFYLKQNSSSQIQLHPGERGKKAAAGVQDRAAI